MDIICASICYRGFAADEVAATLERAPALGYRYMEIHGDAVWTPPAVKVFDLPGVRPRCYTQVRGPVWASGPNNCQQVAKSCMR